MITKKQDSIITYMKQGLDVNCWQEPSSKYEVREFSVQPIGNSNRVMVTRSYSKPGLKHCAHYDCYIVGPRGGFKKVYSKFY